jgi:hypothetical protein
MVDLTTNATLNGQSITVTVYEDTDGDGTSNNSESVNIAGGTNTYSLSNLHGSTSNTFWINADLSGTVTSTPTLHSAELSNFITAPTKPRNVSLTVDSNTQGTVTWDEPSDWGGERGNYRIHISRDSSNYQSPSGGPTTVNDDGSISYSASYNPNSDNSYESQFGIDSNFKFRVRAENSAGSSSWSYTNTKNTDPITPHNPTVNRPDGNTVEISATIKSDIATHFQVEFREDTGAGYGSWNILDTYSDAESHTTGTWATGNRITATFKADTTYQYTNSFTTDSRVQFRMRSYKSETSDWIFCDYGNSGNIFFKDGFESGDFTSWDVTPTTDSYTYVGTSLDGYDGSGRIAESNPPESSYGAQIADGKYVQQNLGDLSNQSNVIVKAYIQSGSLDSSNENNVVKWYDGTSWQTLETHGHERNKQGWEEITLLVPDSYLSTDNRVRFIEGNGSGGAADFLCLDRVVVSDILHEYTSPAAPSNLSLDTSVEDEITASWTNNYTFADKSEAHLLLDGTVVQDHNDNPPVNKTTFQSLKDGEEYGVRVRISKFQYRNGTKSSSLGSSFIGPNTSVTILPNPTSFSIDEINGDQYVVSFNGNSDYGDLRVYISTDDGSTWIDDSGALSRSTTSYTTTSLSSKNTHTIQARAHTEHTESSSSSETEVLAGSLIRLEGVVNKANENGVTMTEK